MVPDDSWIRALTQICCVMRTIIDVKGIGFTDDEIRGAQRYNQAKKLVDEWMRRG